MVASYFRTHTQKVSMVCIHGEKKDSLKHKYTFPGEGGLQTSKGEEDGSKIPGHQILSKDDGQTWMDAEDAGFMDKGGSISMYVVRERE